MTLVDAYDKVICDNSGGDIYIYIYIYIYHFNRFKTKHKAM